MISSLLFRNSSVGYQGSTPSPHLQPERFTLNKIAVVSCITFCSFGLHDAIGSWPYSTRHFSTLWLWLPVFLTLSFCVQWRCCSCSILPPNILINSVLTSCHPGIQHLYPMKMFLVQHLVLIHWRSISRQNPISGILWNVKFARTFFLFSHIKHLKWLSGT